MISAKKTFGFRRRPFFFFVCFGDHLFLAGKTAKICDFGQKKPSDFGEDPFFFSFVLEITCFWPEKLLKFVISAKKSLRISAKTFFFVCFGDHLFLAGKTAKICDFGQKKPLDFGEDLFFF